MFRNIFDKNYIKISVYVLAVLVLAIAFEKFAGNVGNVFASVSGIFKFLLNMLSPVLYGLLVAYFLNASVRFFDRIYGKINRLKERQPLKRLISVATVYIIMIGLLTWIIIYLIPEVLASVNNLIRYIQTFLYSSDTPATKLFTDRSITEVLEGINETFGTELTVSGVINMVLEPVLQFVSSLPTLLTRLVSGTFNIASGLISIVLGLVIAFYMLCEKDNYADKSIRLCFALFRGSTAERIIRTARNSSNVLESFMVGKLIDSVIVGILFFIAGKIAGVQYVLLLSIVVAVTNMIPYFGPFIGAVPVVLITLINSLPDNPWMPVIVIIIVFVLQQIDGMIIGPKILGISTGLKPLDVIIAIIIGGKLFGVAGMFFGVPAYAVLKTAFKSMIDKKFKERHVFVPREATTAESGSDPKPL